MQRAINSELLPKGRPRVPFAFLLPALSFIVLCCLLGAIALSWQQHLDLAARPVESGLRPLSLQRAPLVPARAVVPQGAHRPSSPLFARAASFQASARAAPPPVHCCRCFLRWHWDPQARATVERPPASTPPAFLRLSGRACVPLPPPFLHPLWTLPKLLTQCQPLGPLVASVPAAHRAASSPLPSRPRVCQHPQARPPCCPAPATPTRPPAAQVQAREGRQGLSSGPAPLPPPPGAGGSAPAAASEGHRRLPRARTQDSAHPRSPTRALCTLRHSFAAVRARRPAARLLAPLSVPVAVSSRPRPSGAGPGPFSGICRRLREEPGGASCPASALCAYSASLAFSQGRA